MMNIEYIISIFFSATIPAILTYLATKKNCDTKIKEIKISSEFKVDQLKMEYKHEVEKLQTEHSHQLEKLEYEYQLSKNAKSDDMSSEMTMKFFSGELDIPSILDGTNDLQKLSKKVERMKSKNQMSNYVKKK